MKRLKLWSLVAGLALGSLVGCARTSRNSPGAEDGIRSEREVAEDGREFSPGTIHDKPSACIKWDKGSRRLSKSRKAARDTAVLQRVLDRDKRLQAQNENQLH